MKTWFLSAIAALLVCWSAHAGAISIRYEANDLPDLVVGEDLWSYRYLLTGDFAAFEGINILFAATDYRNLQLTQLPEPSNWFAVAMDPDPGLGADGLLSVFAFTDTSAVDLPFEIEFVWLGGGSPGTQPYEVFDSTFSVVAIGQTTPLSSTVPEPGTLLLLGAGVALLGWRRRRA